ncbi:hypothetical protein G9A89_002164, partial [Geosiphon pyriformis]
MGNRNESILYGTSSSKIVPTSQTQKSACNHTTHRITKFSYSPLATKTRSLGQIRPTLSNCEQFRKGSTVVDFKHNLNLNLNRSESNESSGNCTTSSQNTLEDNLVDYFSFPSFECFLNNSNCEYQCCGCKKGNLVCELEMEEYDNMF